MNGDEKEEAHRPRPLSAGIWTLFSWLRRSERSSSSESVSSVGSARTAVSFDFLAPGNYNFTNTPVVLTTPLNPPTETYKKRLQDRNLRRQRDRDVTLHRKYGLFREYGNSFDGFTLPVPRRTLGNSLDRPNRERRATSESLPRRAAYVPGKRRAPLPPATVNSASLPRTYKRKRPAPKPPIKNNFKNNLIEPGCVLMTSNSESEAKFVPDNDFLNSTKTQKCEKKVSCSKDTKSRTDKNFLKQIFESRKRSSIIDTTSIRLLPSISELDKQATEIIENNKLRQKVNSASGENFNESQNTTALYEGNSWFCTSCLRKYNSSVKSCNFCLPDKRHSLKKDDLRYSSPRTSIYTQTNVHVDNATSSRSSLDERKMLKEILKEMKDSLPKKNKDTKINHIISETPTLRIGSTVDETYKDVTSQPSSSNKNGILSTSSIITEAYRHSDRKNITDQLVLSNVKSPDPINIRKYEITSAFKNKSSLLSTTTGISLSPQTNSYTQDEVTAKNKNNTNSPILKTKISKPQESSITKLRNNIDNSGKSFSNIKNPNESQNLLALLSTETNKNKDVNKTNLQESQEALNGSQNLIKSTPNGTDTDLPKSSKLQVQNFPNSSAVIVNSVKVVVTTHSNNQSSENSNKMFIKNTEKDTIQTSAPKVQNETKVMDLQCQPIQNTSSSSGNVIKKTDNNPVNFENKTNLVKSPETPITNLKQDLHTPLKISSLLNPLYSHSKTIVKELLTLETDASKDAEKRLPSNSNVLNSIDNNKDFPKVNKDVNIKTTPPIVSPISNKKTININNDFKEHQAKDTVKTEVKNVVLKDEHKVLPSTSKCSNGVILVNKSADNVDKLDHYDRRRHLINQLEQSIAKGDEAAAADAAVKLAKLKLSCSVLSFSSQIVGETTISPTISNNTAKQNETNKHITKDTNASTSKDKQIELKTPQVSATAEFVGAAKIKNNVPVDKSVETKGAKQDSIKVSDKSNITPQLVTSGPSTSTQVISEEVVPINVWIEDKQAARGPIRLTISRRATMADLQRQAEQTLGLATQLQRWIVGRTLCSDNAAPVVSLAGPHFRAPFYLCIVQPDKNENPDTNEVISDTKNNGAIDQNGEFYTELMKLEKQALVPNIESFECGVCMEECVAGAGVILRECIHSFCRECLSDVVQHSQEPVVACPATGCSGFLQEREIRTIVTPEEYERWLARGLATAECGTRNAFHCRTRDCTGWAFCDPGVRRFPCPVCKKTNCVQCQAIHEGETCDQYQTKLRQAVTAAETNKDDEGTQTLINSLISRGEALECPECKAIITKKWGCDWVKCSACKTEICWVTKGRRWGPAGRGDTTGGCRCGVDGQRCHPSCGYCH